MCRVIVNSTPLIALGRINRLDLLREVFGCIAIPQAVYDEIMKKTDRASELLASAPGWIKVIQIRNEESKLRFPFALHDGEIEVMILSVELGKKQIVIDDHAARKHAAHLLGRDRVMGTLGVLIIAKRMGIIDEVATIIRELRQVGIRYSDSALQTALDMAGER